MDVPILKEEHVEVRIVNPEEVNDDASTEGTEIDRDGATEECREREGCEGNAKQYIELNMMNYTLVRCDKDVDGGRSPQYQLVAANTVNSSGEDEVTDETVYVLQQPESHEGGEQHSESHSVVMEPTQRQPLYMMQFPANADQHGDRSEDDTSAALLAQVIHDDGLNYRTIRHSPPQKMDRRRKNTFPNPQTLLSSPNFRLFLYHCKLCEFKCNAIQELRDHKKADHPVKPAARSWRPGGAQAAAGERAADKPKPAKILKMSYQCSQCNFTGQSHSELTKHIARRHDEDSDDEELNTYQCDMCSFECNDVRTFDRHANSHLTD